MKEQPTLLLDESAIRELLDMNDYIEITHKVYQGMSERTVINPQKLTLDLGETGDYPYYDGFVNAMPAYIGAQDIAGLKWVGGFTGERKKAGLPFITALIILIDPKIGTFLAVMDGTLITDMRTGAQTATALSYLTEKPEITVGIYGSGMQARMNTRAIAENFTIKKLIVSSRSQENCDAFAKDMEDIVQGEIVTAVDNPEEAAKADVVITVTTAQKPLIKTEWIEPGTIVFPLGSFQEIEDELIFRADKIIVDHPKQALHRGALKKLTSEGNIDEEDVTATLGQLASGKLHLGDLSEEITICIPIGMGAVDVAAAAEAYKRALDKGYNTTFDYKA